MRLPSRLAAVGLTKPVRWTNSAPARPASPALTVKLRARLARGLTPRAMAASSRSFTALKARPYAECITCRTRSSETVTARTTK
jgi:hypothetical protein